MRKERRNTYHEFSALEFSIIDTKGVGWLWRQLSTR